MSLRRHYIQNNNYPKKEHDSLYLRHNLLPYHQILKNMTNQNNPKGLDLLKFGWGCHQFCLIPGQLYQTNPIHRLDLPD